MWVSEAHIPDKNNIAADQQSRILQDATESKLIPELFQKIVDKFGKPDIALFASRISRKLKRYASKVKVWLWQFMPCVLLGITIFLYVPNF